MRKIACLILLAANVLLPATYAADKKKPPSKPAPQVWEKEPDSFLGISFSSAVESAARGCPRDKYGIDFSRLRDEKQVCIEIQQYMKDYVRIYGTPDTGFPYSVSAHGWEKGIAYFYMTTQPAYFPLMVELFISRYGQPTTSEKETVKTKAGAEFQNEEIRWEGKEISIRLVRYDGDINTSSASINSKAFLQNQAQKRREKATEGAAKF